MRSPMRTLWNRSHRTTVPDAIVKVPILGVRLNFLRVFNGLVKNLQALAARAKFQAVPYQRLNPWYPQFGADGRDSTLALALPQPLANAATISDHLGKIGWQGLQQFKYLDQIRLAGTVRADQDIQRSERQRLAIGRKRQHPAWVDGLNESLHERPAFKISNPPTTPPFICGKTRPPARNVASANAVMIPSSSSLGHRPESSSRSEEHTSELQSLRHL